jgi:ATP-dependent RNA helicase DDX1
LKNARLRLNFGSGPTTSFRFPPKRVGFVGIAQARPDSLVSSQSQGGAKATPVERKPNQPMCLILEPTKELAQQTHTQIARFAKHLKEPPIKWAIF